jgi:hypothetical protein
MSNHRHIFRWNPQYFDVRVICRWQKVLEEFASRRGSMTMKKVEVVEKKVVGKLKKGGKKKEGFNDIIDELSHRLARMRGEIVDEEEEDEDSAPAPAPAPTSSKSKVPAFGAAKPKETEASSSSSSSAVAPAMKPARPPLQNIPKPPPLDPKSPFFSSLPASAVPAGATESSAKPVPALPSCSYSIAVPKPAVLPSPPPLPLAWPPLAPFLLTSKGDKKKTKRNSKSKRRRSRKSFQATTSVVTTATKLLPGYYLPSPDFNSVPAGEVLAAGFTTAEMCVPINQSSQRTGGVSGSVGGSPPGRSRTEKVVGGGGNSAPGGGKGSVGYGIGGANNSGGGSGTGGPAAVRKFVPQFNAKQPYLNIPTNSNSAIGSSRQNENDLSNSAAGHSVGDFIMAADDGSSAYSRHSQTTKRIVVEDLPLPNNYHDSIRRMQESVRMREERLEKSKEGAFRQYPKAASATRVEKTVPKEFESSVSKRLETKSHSYRKSSEKSNPDSLPQSHRVQPMTASAKMLGIHDTSGSYFLTTLRDETRLPTKVTKVAHDEGGVPKTLDRRRPVGVYGSQNQHGSSSYDSENRLKAQAPAFFHMYGVERRSSERNDRKRQEAAEANARKEGLKLYKEHVHQQAMMSAVMSGVYDPTVQIDSHEKLVRKYGSSDLDPAAIAAAKREYMLKHSLPGSAQKAAIQWSPGR